MFEAKAFGLLVLWLSIVKASTTTRAYPTGTFEVDLIFPRQTSFAARDPIPIVFAVQNYDVAVSSEFSISWQISQLDSALTLGSGNINLINGNDTWNSSAPYFMVDAFQVNPQTLPNQSYYFSWSVEPSLCQSPDPASSSWWNPVIDNATTFSTNASNFALNLTAATATDACASTQNFVFDVTSSMQWPPAPGGSYTSCAELQSQWTSNGSPCAVSIDATKASEIWALATDAACRADKSSTLSNPYLPKLNCSAYYATLSKPASQPTTTSAGNVRLMPVTWVSASIAILLMEAVLL